MHYGIAKTLLSCEIQLLELIPSNTEKVKSSERNFEVRRDPVIHVEYKKRERKKERNIQWNLLSPCTAFPSRCRSIHFGDIFGLDYVTQNALAARKNEA